MFSSSEFIKMTNNQTQLCLRRVSWDQGAYSRCAMFYCLKRDHWCLESGITHGDKSQGFRRLMKK